MEGNGLEAHFRGWSTTEEGRNIPTTCPGSFRVMTYNVLASRYVTTDNYPHCPTWALADNYRAKQILSEVRGCDADILCFQELSIEMHDEPNLFGGVLRRELGYDSYHQVITAKDGSMCHRADVNGTEVNDAVRKEFEGVAIFFKTARWRLHEAVPVKFNVVAQCDKALLPHERQRLQATSHNVGLIVVLEDKSTGGFVVAATMHTVWDSVQKPECQVYQMHCLLSKCEELKGMYEMMSNTAVVVCGDFNSELNSYCLNFALNPSSFFGDRSTDNAGLVAGCSSSSAPPPPNLFADWIVNPRTHGLNLHDSYTHYCMRNPTKVTAVNPSFNKEGKVLDHILFEKECLICVAVGRLGSMEEIPTKTVPSDHYPLAATFVPVHHVMFMEDAVALSEGEE